MSFWKKPQTIFALDNGFDLSVMEMGTNHFGEIERLSYMAKPDVCVFTNIGVSHIEHLGSREGILKEKMDLLAHAKKLEKKPMDRATSIGGAPAAPATAIKAGYMATT